MAKFYLMLYGVAFLPAFFFGFSLPGEKSRGVFGSIAIIGIIILIFLTLGLFSIANAPEAVNAAAGLAGLLILALGGGSVSFGVLAGIISREAKERFGENRTGLWQNFAFLAPFLIPLSLTLILCLFDVVKNASRKYEQNKEMYSYWKQDVSIKFGEHNLELPISPRLRANHRGFMTGWHAHRSFKEFDSPNDSLYSLSVYGLKDECMKLMRDSICTELNNKWCKLRPELAQSFWCLDYLDSKTIRFTTDAVIQFVERKKWLRKSNADSPVHQRYARSNAKIIVHEKLGKDKREEDIISVCYSYPHKKNPQCKIEYAVEADILATVNYDLPPNSISDEEIKKNIISVEKLWQNLKNSEVGI